MSIHPRDVEQIEKRYPKAFLLMDHAPDFGFSDNIIRLAVDYETDSDTRELSIMHGSKVWDPMHRTPVVFDYANFVSFPDWKVREVRDFCNKLLGENSDD